MKGGKSPRGYTIVEVMIVLAVSGFMFLIATQFINGRQGRAAFTQGSNDFANRLQSLAAQVGDGQFTDISLGQCSVSASGLTFTGSGVTQGTNKDCVFLGKLIYLHNAARPTAYRVFNLAGATQDKTTGTLITTLDSTTQKYVTALPSLTTDQPIPQGLEASQMRVTPLSGGPAVTNYSLGFIQGLGSASNAAEDNAAVYQTGSQTIGMIYGQNLTAPEGSVESSSVANPGNITGKVAYASRAEICLTDGTHRATIAIDIQNGGLNVNLTNLNNGAAPCW